MKNFIFAIYPNIYPKLSPMSRNLVQIVFQHYLSYAQDMIYPGDIAAICMYLSVKIS